MLAGRRGSHNRCSRERRNVKREVPSSSDPRDEERDEHLLLIKAGQEQGERQCSCLPVSLHSVFLIISEEAVRSVHFYWWTLLLNKVSVGRVSAARLMNRGDHRRRRRRIRGRESNSHTAALILVLLLQKAKEITRETNWEAKGGEMCSF